MILLIFFPLVGGISDVPVYFKCVQSIVFESFNIQAGMDGTGVPTKMLSLNSTVRISFRNPATFFGVHVSSTPITLYYYQLEIAQGNVSLILQ